MEQKTKYESIVLMGHAGTGKGTQAKHLAEHFNYCIFSTGDKARETAALDSPLGRLIESIHTRGWIPEWLASYFLVKVLIEDCVDTGVVFESVARKPEEARKLHEIHQATERSYVVVLLEADESVLEERLLARNRPGYDVKEKIQQRREAFESETMQSVNYFKERADFFTVDASQPAEDVFKEIVEKIT
ncbi:MAG: nucleoside monophosphate kinase [Patescibacteria group bacterium]